MYKEKNYINEKTIEEVEEKGFSVYNYISFSELISTVNKDYLQTLNTINIPFAILTAIALFISYESHSYIYLILLFLGVYSLVFIYLIGKLIYRTYKFSLVTNVIYTKKGLVINDEVHHYKNDLKLKTLLEKLEKLFNEYLSKPSNLKEVIKYEKEKLFKKLSRNFETVNKGLESKSSFRVSNNNDSGKLILLIYAALIAYSISVIVFYFIGLALGFILFFIIISFISLYFSINKSIELRIKQEVTKIDKEIKSLDDIYESLNKKVSTFSSGEIFDLSKHIEDEYDSFYSKINKAIDLKDGLKETIETSKYKDFIDFTLFAIYLKNQFNKPLNKMIELLEEYKAKVQKELNEAINTFENIDSKEKYKIEPRIANLQTINKNITLHLEQLKISIL